MKNITFKNLTEEQINAIKVLLGDACDIEEKVEEEILSFPQSGDRYCLICADGNIGYDSYDPDSDTDKARLSLGNIFNTYEDAEFEVERLKVLHEIKQFAEPEDYEWNGDNEHYYMYWSFLATDTVRIGRCSTCKSNHIYFKSFEDAEACIKTVGEDRIKTYYLKVKEPDREDNNV